MPDLTKSIVDLLSCPAGKKDVLFFDSKLAGFGVRVTAKGSKIFLVQYGRGGATKRVTIGKMGVITPTEARRKALIMIADIQGGGDPVEARKRNAEAVKAAKNEEARLAADRRKADEFTVERLLEAWRSVKLKARSKRYSQEAPNNVRRLLGRLAEAPAASITVKALQIIVDREISRAPTQTIDARACGRAAWNWAKSRGFVQDNPFEAVVIEHRLKSRDRVLSDAELAEAWRAAVAKPYPFGPAVQLLILTLQRLSEVMGMRWSELADDLSAWTISAERVKNGRAHVVHLSEPARDILRGLQTSRAAREKTLLEPRGVLGVEAGKVEDPAEIDFVFTMTGKTPVSGVSRARRSLDTEVPEDDFGARRAFGEKATKKKAKVRTDWRFHDFRRTGVSKLAELGIPPHVADRILNHVTGSIQGVAAVYQRFQFLPERKRALDVWAAHVLAVASGDAKASNVHTLPNALDRIRDPAA